MKLDEALRILAQAHTRYDDRVGFTIETHPKLDYFFSQGNYVEAWQTVRMHLHMNVNPSKVTPMADVTYEDHIIRALQDWKADSDRHFPWVGGKPQRVLSIPLSAILLDQSSDRAYVTADDLIAAFGRTE